MSKLYGVTVKTRQELANGHEQTWRAVWCVNRDNRPAVSITLTDDSHHTCYWVTVEKAASPYDRPRVERYSSLRLTDARRLWARYIRYAKKGIL